MNDAILIFSTLQLFSAIDADGGKNLSRDEVAEICGGSTAKAESMMKQMEDIENSVNGFIELREWMQFVRKIKVNIIQSYAY